jgi:membrane-associated protease RseP (regulator of RpoE activity)
LRVKQLVFEPSAVRAGIRAGDRIVAVNGERHDDGAGISTAIVKNSPDDQVLLTLIRNGVEIEQKVRCMDGRPIADKLVAMFRSAAEARWRDCIAASYELERPPLMTNYSVPFMRHSCNQAERLAARRPPTNADASLLYEARRREIEEANYVPGAMGKVRGEVLTTISWLEQNKFSNFATDLRGLLDKASLTRVDSPPAPNAQPAPSSASVAPPLNPTTSEIPPASLPKKEENQNVYPPTPIVSTPISFINRAGSTVSCPPESPDSWGLNSCVGNAESQGFVRVPDVSAGMSLDWDSKPVKIIQVSGAAAEAGVRAGDLLVELDGNKIVEAISIFKIVSKKQPGDYIIVKIVRGGKPMDFTYRLMTR